MKAYGAGVVQRTAYLHVLKRPSSAGSPTAVLGYRRMRTCVRMPYAVLGMTVPGNQHYYTMGAAYLWWLYSIHGCRDLVQAKANHR